MGIAESLLLALVQGATEFLPVSSSGHLVLLGTLISSPSSERLPYIIVLHLGTALAALIYYRRDLLSLAGGIVADSEEERGSARRTLVALALATAVTALAALPFRNFLEGLFLTSATVAPGLFVTGLLLFFASPLAPRRHRLGELPWWKAVVVGLAQAAAIVPGISRSGATIAAALFIGLERGEAVRFSFLLLLPAVTGAALLEAASLPFPQQVNLLHYLTGFAAAAAIGYLAIAVVLRWTGKGRLKLFAYYCWALAALAGTVFR